MLDLVGGILDLLAWGGGSGGRRRRGAGYRLAQVAIVVGAVYFAVAEWSNTHDGSRVVAAFLIALVGLTIAAFFLATAVFAVRLLLRPVVRLFRRRRAARHVPDPPRYIA